MSENLNFEEPLSLNENETLEHPAKRFRFNWILPVLLHPKKAFAEITSQNQAVWLTPLLLLSLLIVLNVLAAGSAQAATSSVGQVTPPDYEYYSPQMQDQFTEAMQATTDPVVCLYFSTVNPSGWVMAGLVSAGQRNPPAPHPVRGAW